MIWRWPCRSSSCGNELCSDPDQCRQRADVAARRVALFAGGAAGDFSATSAENPLATVSGLRHDHFGRPILVPLFGDPFRHAVRVGLAGPAVAGVLYAALRGELAAGGRAWAATLLGYGLWTRLLSRHPVNQVAPFSLLIPLIGLTTGWLLFDEILQTAHFIGSALLMGGLAVNLFGTQWVLWLRKRA